MAAVRVLRSMRSEDLLPAGLGKTRSEDHIVRLRSISIVHYRMFGNQVRAAAAYYALNEMSSDPYRKPISLAVRKLILQHGGIEPAQNKKRI